MEYAYLKFQDMNLKQSEQIFALSRDCVQRGAFVGLKELLLLLLLLDHAGDEAVSGSYCVLMIAWAHKTYHKQRKTLPNKLSWDAVADEWVVVVRLCSHAWPPWGCLEATCLKRPRHVEAQQCYMKADMSQQVCVRVHVYVCLYCINWDCDKQCQQQLMPATLSGVVSK